MIFTAIISCFLTHIPNINNSIKIKNFILAFNIFVGGIWITYIGILAIVKKLYFLLPPFGDESSYISFPMNYIAGLPSLVVVLELIAFTISRLIDY
jgi:hypothetical protein